MVCVVRSADQFIAYKHRTNNATIEVIIEGSNFNNSLAGSLACPNAYVKPSGSQARETWVNTYLQNGNDPRSYS